VLVFFVVSDVAPPGFSKFAGNIINLGINTTLSRKLLTSNPDKKIGQAIVIFSGQRSSVLFCLEPRAKSGQKKGCRGQKAGLIATLSGC
jgi:hypothetical protein